MLGEECGGMVLKKRFVFQLVCVSQLGTFAARKPCAPNPRYTEIWILSSPHSGMGVRGNSGRVWYVFRKHFRHYLIKPQVFFLNEFLHKRRNEKHPSSHQRKRERVGHAG